MKKTLEDFKQEVAERRGCLVEDVEQYHMNETAELYAEYRAKEEFSVGYKQCISDGGKYHVDKARTEGWNEALHWAAEQIVPDGNPMKAKELILKGLK